MAHPQKSTSSSLEMREKVHASTPSMYREDEGAADAQHRKVKHYTTPEKKEEKKNKIELKKRMKEIGFFYFSIREIIHTANSAFNTLA